MVRACRRIGGRSRAARACRSFSAPPKRSAQIALAGLLLAIVPSYAEAQSRAEVAEARQLWQEGRDAATREEWELSIERFRASFAIVERASTAVSLATVLVHLERHEEALEYLDALERLADPEDEADLLASGAQLRVTAEAAIRERAPLAAPEPVAPVPATVESTPPDDDGLGRLVGPLAVAGGGGAAFLVAAITFSLREDALGRRDALCPEMLCPSRSVLEQAESEHAEADSMNTATNVLLVLGSLAALGGLTWLTLTFVLDGEGTERAALVITPRGLALRGTLP